MAAQELVAPDQIQGIISTAARRTAPVALTSQVQQVWRTYRSRFLGTRGGGVWVEYAQDPEDEVKLELAAGEKIGVAFKHRHFKFVFPCLIEAVERFATETGEVVPAARLEWPTAMHQLQRRMFIRADVPDERAAFVHFWEGGLALEPQDGLREKLTYTGQLADLSAGGFRVRLFSNNDPGFTRGQPMGATLSVTGESSPISVDAQFRHASNDEFSVVLGMQIVGLAQTPEGRDTLERISRLAREFDRTQRRQTRTRLANRARRTMASRG